MSVVSINLTGLGALGVALFGMALASEHFGDTLLYLVCVVGGIACISVAVIAKVYAVYRYSQQR